MPEPCLTVLMPAYNEEACLAETAGKVLGRLRELAVPAELLIVDDGSLDNTARIADQLATQHTEVRVCHHPANLGIGGGFMTGVREARGRWLILVPADLAMDLADLGKYLDASCGADVVVGVRVGRGDYTPYRMLVSQLNVWAVRLLFGMRLRQYNYISLYRLDLLRALGIECWRSAFFYAEILIKLRDLGACMHEVEIHYAPRPGGRPTGAKAGNIVRAAADMARFWLRGGARRTLRSSRVVR